MSNMVVGTNILAIQAHRSMKLVGAAQTQASARLSTGLRINSAADDAAGLAITKTMEAQISGLNQASRNAQDGISVAQTAEGGMAQISDMLNRMRTLAVQASNDSNTQKDRVKMQDEVNALLTEINQQTTKIQFNTMNLLDGTFKNKVFQVGANANQVVSITIGTMTVTALKLSKLVGVGSGKGIAKANGSAVTSIITTVNDALDTVAAARAKLGAVQNRLQYTIQGLDIASQNLSSSRSQIADADMAQEMMNLTKQNVLQQAATSMLAQANQQPQNLLQLLR